jgi:lipopolysaccharide transport system ATP-binding protein
MNGTILGMTKREIDRKFDEIVDFSGVEKFLDTPIKRYSSGMIVRLAFSVAAHLEPEILIIDEVLAVGDQSFQQKCLGRMQNISALGRTVLFVSHNMAAVQNLCQRVLVVDRGSIQYNGPAEQGIQCYLNGFLRTESSEIDLSNHPSRRTDCSRLLSRLKMRRQNGELTTQFLCGEPIVLEVDLEAAPELAEVHCWVQVLDEFGTRLFTVGTELSDATPFRLDKSKRLRCHIREPQLAPGTYTLTILAGPIGKRRTDFIEQAACLNVVASDFYGNGCMPNHVRGPFVVRSSWTEA